MGSPRNLVLLPPDPGLHRRTDARAPSRRWEVIAAVLGVLAVVFGVLMTVGSGEVEQRRETLIVRVVAACRADDNPDYLLYEACREASAQHREAGLTPAVPVPTIAPPTPTPQAVPMQRWSLTFRGVPYACTRTGGPNDRPTYNCVAEGD